MADTSIVTARIASHLVTDLDRLATEYERPRGWHIARAIARYAAEEIQLLGMVKEGEADFAAGRFHTQDEVEALFAVCGERSDAA